MPIINVNAFQNGISKKNYLTSYTDAYLKQSLANLGQRNAAKGDSIGFSSFSIQDLFPNYTGDFNENDLLVQVVLYPTENRVGGYLKLLQDDGSLKELSSEEANTKFVVDNIDHSIRGLEDGFDEDSIMLSDVDRINNVDYWHKESATFFKTDNSFIYKVVGHHESGVYGEYDNEYVCEEVSDSGEFIEGFRIFIVNEENLMQSDDPDENGPSSRYAHEKLALIHLHKNYDKVDDSLRNHEWVLDVYKVKENLGEGANNEYYIGLGDARDLLEESRIDELIAKYADSSNINSPSSVISNVMSDIIDGNGINQIAGIVSKCYSVPVDYDTPDNANWSIPSDFISDKWKKMSASSSFSSDGTGQMAPDADGNQNIDADIDIIVGDTLEHTNGKLEYFVSDTKQLYPRLLEIYNQVMYKSDSNIKIKERIVSELTYKAWRSSLSMSSVPDETNLYVMYFPTNYEFKYNCNSNDESLIYNMTGSIPVQYEYINELGKDTISNVTDNVSFLKKLVHLDGTEPNQYIYANSEIERTVLYDMNVNYSSLDDTIILSIDWKESFIMPYINSNGYWVINGLATNNYAKGIVADQSSLMIVASTDLHEFNPYKNVLSGIGLDVIKSLSSSDFEKKTFSSNYIDTNANVGAHNTFSIEAWVPSDEYLKSIRETETFTYFKDAIIMNISSTELEKDSTYIQYAYYSGSSIHKDSELVIGTEEEIWNAYNNRQYSYGKYEDWSIGNDSTYSYIYRYARRSGTIQDIIGGVGTVTSFWTCEEKTDYSTNSTYYAFDYIKNPKYNNEVALDFNYICNLEQYIKYYAKYSFSPDDYEHTQLLFDPVLQLLKNNTISYNSSLVYPVILNHNADYYNPTLGIDVTKGIGMSYEGDEQYFNSMNLAIEFDDNIGHDDGHVSYVLNGTNTRRFTIDSYTTTYIEPYSYYGTYYAEDDTTKSFPKVGLIKGNLEHYTTYGIIPKVISMTNFPKEYIPNSEYNPNGYVGNQYPMVDLKEVTVRNASFWNRSNILVADKVQFNPALSYGVIYNAYIGSAYDQENKNVLHIGTSETNINLGTTSMVDKDSIHHLTKMDKMQIDFDTIELNGYTSVKGEIITSRPSWTTYAIDNYNTYTTTIYPIGILEEREELESGKIPSGTSALLSNVKFKLRKKKQTRYYVQNESRNVSYLNASVFLTQNNISNDKDTVWHGDATLLTTRRKENIDSYLAMYNVLANLNENYPGTWQAMSYYYNTGNIWQGVSEDYVANTLSRIHPTIDEWNSYGLSYICELSKNIPLYTIEDGKNVPIMEDTTDKDDYGNPIRVQKTGTAYVLNFKNATDVLNDHSWYLELSTDLTDKENTLAEGHLGNAYDEERTTRLVLGNPIEVSYVDVLSYQAPIETKTYTYVSAYMYASSYTEYWSCDGCDLCSAKDCPMIDKCSKSKVQGFFTPAYGFVIGNLDTDAFTYANENVYTYTHVRYRKVEDSNDYERYTVMSYWPTTIYKTKDDFSTDEEFDAFITKTEDGVSKKLTYYPSTGEYKWIDSTLDEAKSYIAKEVPIGQNVISSYILSYIEEYGKLNTDLRMKVSSVNPSKITYLNEDNITYSDLSFTYAYITQDPTEVTIGGQTYVPLITNFNEATMPCAFSYYEWKTDIAYYDATIRHINIREVMTSHSVPEFWNERLVKIDNTDNPVKPDPVDPDPTPNPEPGYPKPTEKVYDYKLETSCSSIYGYAAYGEDEVILKKDGNVTDDKYLSFIINASYKEVDQQWKAQLNDNGVAVWVEDDAATKKLLEKAEWKSSNDYAVTMSDNSISTNYTKSSNTYKLNKEVSKNNSSNIVNGTVTITYKNLKKSIDIDIRYASKTTTNYVFDVYIDGVKMSSSSSITFNYGDTSQKNIKVYCYKITYLNGNYVDSNSVDYTIKNKETGKEQTMYFDNIASTITEVDKSDKTYPNGYVCDHTVKVRSEIATSNTKYTETWVIQPNTDDNNNPYRNTRKTIDLTRKKK